MIGLKVKIHQHSRIHTRQTKIVRSDCRIILKHIFAVMSASCQKSKIRTQRKGSLKIKIPVRISVTIMIFYILLIGSAGNFLIQIMCKGADIASLPPETFIVVHIILMKFLQRIKRVIIANGCLYSFNTVFREFFIIVIMHDFDIFTGKFFLTFF